MAHKKSGKTCNLDELALSQRCAWPDNNSKEFVIEVNEQQKRVLYLETLANVGDSVSLSSRSVSCIWRDFYHTHCSPRAGI